MRLTKTRLAIIGVIAANVIWGASFPLYKWSLENIEPFTFVFLRFFLGAFVILPFILNDLKIQRHNIRLLLILSLFSVTLQIPLLFLGLQLTSSINAPIIISSSPIILILISVLYLKEKTNLKIITGALLSLAGVILIIVRPILEGGLDISFLGNLLIFLGMMCSIVQAVILKKTTDENPLTITFWSFLLGSIPLIPFVVWESNNVGFLNGLNIQGVIGLIYGIVLAAVLAHILIAYGMRFIKASEVGLFTYVDPIATALVAIPLLGEKITISYVFGAILVFAGIFIAEGRLHYHPLRRLR